MAKWSYKRGVVGNKGISTSDGILKTKPMKTMPAKMGVGMGKGQGMINRAKKPLLDVSQADRVRRTLKNLKKPSNGVGVGI